MSHCNKVVNHFMCAHVYSPNIGEFLDDGRHIGDALGLSANNKAAILTLEEVMISVSADRLRHLFATLLICGMIDDVNVLWIKFKKVCPAVFACHFNALFYL